MLIEMTFAADLPPQKIKEVFGEEFMKNFSNQKLQLDDLERIETQLISNEDVMVGFKLDGKVYG